MNCHRATVSPIAVLIPCVDYADFLELSLPTTKRHFESITVVTHPEDKATIRVCLKYGVRSFLSCRWYSSGAIFNKAAALNEAIAEKLWSCPHSWILSMDADILLPEDFVFDACALSQENLYSIPRRLCDSEEEWRQLSLGGISREDLPLSNIPIKEGRVWGRPTGNPIGLSGYFHLWSPSVSGLKRYPEKPTAARYDVEFALHFQDSQRKYLDGCECIHLGPPRTNWNGRVSTWWSGGESSDELPSRAGNIVRHLQRKGIMAKEVERITRMVGSRHPVFGFSVDSQKYFLKLFGEHEANLVRVEEGANRKFASIVCVPEILATSISNPILGAPYILSKALPDGFCPIRNGITQEAFDALCDFFKRRNRFSIGTSRGGVANGYHDYQNIESHLEIAQRIHHILEETSVRLTDFSTQLLKRLQLVSGTLQERKLTFQHGDLSPSNVFLNASGDVALIDFEAAGLDDRVADIYSLCHDLFYQFSGREACVERFMTCLLSDLATHYDSAAWQYWSVLRWYKNAQQTLQAASPGARNSELVAYLLEYGRRIIPEIDV